MIKNAKKAYTLLELMIALTVLCAVAGLAISSYAVSVEKARAKEGEQILYAWMSSLKRYEVENPGLISNDDVTNKTDFIKPNSQYFNTSIAVVRNYGANNGDHDFGVSVVRKNGPLYSLFISMVGGGAGATGYYALTLVNYGKNSITGPPSTMRMGCVCDGSINICQKLGY